LTYATVLRARVALADDEQARARDELLAMSVMARHAALDALLVGTMIQIAIEMRILDFVRDHFDQLKPQTRTELADGLRSRPPRATVADAMVNEKLAIHGWLLDHMEEFRSRQNSEEKVLAQFRTWVTDALGTGDDLGDRIVEAAGGTS